MLWLCLHFPQLPAESQGLRDDLDVVTDSRGTQRWLITAAPGLPAGMPLGDALALKPDLRAHSRKPAAERAALKTLAHGIYRYGSPVVAELQALPEPGRLPRALLWVEVGASRRLFGGLDVLRQQLCADLVELQQSAQLATAPTRSGAALLALSGIGEPVETLRDLHARLSDLPVQTLLWPQAELDALHGMGLRRLRDLFALPRTGFARRFGPARLLELDRLRGLAPEPVQAITPPPLFRRRFELPGEVETLEGLLFPLRRMSLELQHWLRARDTGLHSLELHCGHAHRRRTQFGLRFLSAHRDAARIFDALRERLNREPLTAPVRTLYLHVDDLGPVPGGQMALFSGEHDAQLQWTETVERLLARLGESALWTPAVMADHRPERAGEAMRCDDALNGIVGIAERPAMEGRAGGREYSRRRAMDGGTKARPLWLLPTPTLLPSRPAITSDPERIESGAWDGDDVRRDYYVADWHSARGWARAWVFRDHASGRWFLHGWFA